MGSAESKKVTKSTVNPPRTNDDKSHYSRVVQVEEKERFMSPWIFVLLQMTHCNYELDNENVFWVSSGNNFDMSHISHF